MTDRKPWPSRRLQITVAILLAVGAGITAFVPPIGREKQAQKLYEDAWFQGGLYGNSDKAAAVKSLQKALELSPGNSLYEQALVWLSPSKDLPDLVKKGKLDAKAKRLAYRRIYGSRENYWSHADDKDSLHKALELARLDSDNSIAHYYAAGCLAKAGRVEEAFSEVKAGNKIGSGHFYLPETTKQVFDSLASPGMNSYNTMGATARNTARQAVALGNSRLRKGDVLGACDAFEACCKMGVVYASSEHGSMIDSLVGQAIFSIGWASLKPVCKDFGLKDKFDRYAKIEAAFDGGQEGYRSFTSTIIDNAMREAYSTYGFPAITTLGAVISIFGIVLSFLVWGIARIAVRAKKQERYHISPWGEGWPVRLFLSVYLPVFALFTIGLALVLHHPSFDSESVFGIGICVLMGIGQFVVLGIMMRKLRRSFDAVSGEPRIRFRAPANREEWNARWMIAGMGIQAAFFICIGFLVIMLFKPVYGMQIWQPERMPYRAPSIELRLSKEAAMELRNASPREWRLGK